MTAQRKPVKQPAAGSSEPDVLREIADLEAVDAAAAAEHTELFEERRAIIAANLEAREARAGRASGSVEMRYGLTGRVAARVSREVQPPRRDQPVDDKPSAAQIQLNKRVRDVLGRELAAQLLPEQPAEVDAAKPDRLRVINARMEALETARNLLRKAIEEKRGPASAAICERVAPEFNGLCDDLIAKSLELHAAFLAYMQFADKMNSA